MNIIETKNLNLWFADNHVLKNVNIAVENNKITALIGPSGCGKSTLLRTFNRMNDLSPVLKIKGEVYLEQENIFSADCDVNDLRTRVGMVFQRPNPFPKSIYDNVSYGPKLKGVAKKDLEEKVVSALKAAWIWDEVKDRLHKSALRLSGGQQQRLCIARAIANDSKVLLLDEPTSALDPKSTLKIEELCLRLKKQMAILIVTHNIGQAGRISDDTAFMYLGEIVEFGKTKHLFTNPQKKMTEDYLQGNFG